MSISTSSAASSSPITWAYQPSLLEAQAAVGVDRDIWYWPRAPDEYQSLGGTGIAMAWMLWHESQAQAWWHGYRACQAQLAATLYPVDSDQHSSQQAPSASPLPSSAQPPSRSNLAAPEVHALKTACYDDHLNRPVPSDDGHAHEEDIVDYAYGCSSRHLLSDYVDDVYFSPSQAHESDAANSSSAFSSSSDSLSSSADGLDDSLPAPRHAWSECDGAYSFDVHDLADDPIPAALRARHSFSDVKLGPTGQCTLQATKTLPLYAEERRVPLEI